VIQGLVAGANDYIAKPFYSQELIARLGVGRRVVELQADLARRVDELEEALRNVNLLQGLLPICSYCKKIRDEANHWHRVEAYVSDHSEVTFSHGVCPECFQRLMNEEKGPQGKH
jgi:hypothetical protein